MFAALEPFHHVYDSTSFHLPFGIHPELPKVMGLQITKFMVLQVLAAVLVFVIFKGLASRARGGKPVGGYFWNFWELLVVKLRDEVVRPVIGEPHHHDDGHGHDDGHHENVVHGHMHRLAEAPAAHTTDGALVASHPADEYLPYVLSAFFYILFCNLLGAFPWFGSATGNINVTAALALTAFGASYYWGSKAKGPVKFWTSMVPEIDAPPGLKQFLIGLLFFVESLGVLIKHGVLAVRLFCNIMGGHTVLGVILAFISMAAAASASYVWWIVAPGSLAGQVGVGLLELLVAFIQAYVFAFLSTIFISMSIHDH